MNNLFSSWDLINHILADKQHSNILPPSGYSNFRTGSKFNGQLTQVHFQIKKLLTHKIKLLQEQTFIATIKYKNAEINVLLISFLSCL